MIRWLDRTALSYAVARSLGLGMWDSLNAAIRGHVEARVDDDPPAPTRPTPRYWPSRGGDA